MKHINLTQMLQGCSKRNGMTVSASMHDDGQNCNVKQRAELMSEDEKWSENGALSSTCLRSALVPLSFRSRYLRYAAMIFCVLAMSVGQAWGDSYMENHATPSANSGDFTQITVTDKVSFGNSSLQINENAASGSFTIAVLDGSYIDSITFARNGDYPVGTLEPHSGTSGTVTNRNSGAIWKFVPSANISTATFDMSAPSGKKTRLNNIKVYWKSDYEYFTKNFSVSSGTVSCTKSNTSTDVTLTTTGGTSSNYLTVNSGKTLTITSSGHNIKSVHFVFQNHASATYTASTGTYSSNAWTAGDDTQTVTFSSTASTAIAGISVELVDLGVTHTVTAATDNASYGTAAAAKTTVAEGATTTITATPNSGYQFDHWTVSGTGASLSSTTTNPTTLTMGTANATVTAYFVVDPCSAWGYGTANTTAPSSGNSVTVGDLTVANVGCSTSSTTPFSGGTSTGVILGNGTSKYITGTLGGDEIESIRFSIYTTDAAKPTYVVAFSSSATYDAATVLKVSGDYTAYFYDDAPLASGTRKDVEVTAPAGAKSFAIGRNLSGVSHGGTEQNSGSRGVYYIAACPADASSCTAFSFHTGGSDVWNTHEDDNCFTQIGSTKEWRIDDYTRPNHTHYVVNWQGGKYSKGGDNNASFASHSWSDMSLALARSAKVSEGAIGVQGSLRIYADSYEENLYVGFIPAGYTVRLGANNYAATGTTSSLTESVWKTDVVKITSSNSSSALSVGLKTSSGSADYSQTKSVRQIFFQPNTNWKTANAEFYIYYWGTETDWGDDKMIDPDGDGIYEGWIPATGTTKIEFVRINPDAASKPGWGDGTKWNSTGNLSLDGTKNLWAMTESGDNWSAGAWSQYDVNGKFRIWADNAKKNFHVHLWPHYVLTYDANTGSGTMSEQSVAADAVSKTVSVAANGFTAPKGKHFVNWNTAPGGGGTSYAPSASYSLTADATLYAQWAWNTYDVSTTLAQVTVKSGTTGTGAATHGTAYTVTLQGATGYNLPVSVTVMCGSTNITANCTWTQGTGVLTIPAAQVTGNISISATGVAKTTAITLEAGDGGTDGSATATYGTSTITGYVAATRTGYTLGNYYQDAGDHNILTDAGALNSGDKGTLIKGGKWASEDAAVTLYAQWTAIDYTIAYDLAGGSVASPNPTSYTIESAAITLNNPTKTGYTFAGWTGTGLDAATTAVTIAAGSTGNRSYTATWSSTAPTISGQPSDVNCNVGDERSISVTASISTGGTPTYQWQVSDNGSSDWANVASSGTSASYTVPTASEGTKYYHCVVTNPNGSATTTSDAATVTVTAAAGTIYYLVTSTAQLNTTDTYVIMDDGKAAMMGVADGSNAYLNKITSGFTVAGDKSTVTVTSSDVNTLTLQAESSAWNIVGKNNKKLSTKGSVDEKLYANTDKAAASGTDDFVFSFADGKATIKRNTSTDYHIYYTSGTGFNQSTTATNIRLYTSNSTPVYTVTYDLNGGEGTLPTNRPEKSGTEITLASSAGLTKDGFTFDGWLCSVNSTKYAAGASYTMTAVNTTFTAQWVEAVAPTLYTVSFESNGGSEVSPITQASAGASITMPVAPTYASHTFQGWVIGGTTKAAGASYTPAANVTAYATWKANCAGGGGSGSTEVYNGENVAKGNTTASGWTINNSSDMTLTSGSSNGYSYWYQAGSSTSYVQFDGSASLVAGDQIKIQWTHTNGSDKTLNLAINGSSASLTSGGTTKNSVKVEAVYDVTSATTVTSIKLKSSGSSGCIIYQVTIVKASGGGCCYVTYNGNGAESGCISDKTAYTAGEGDVTILGNTGVSAYVKLGYRFNGWNTAANGSGMAYAAGDVVENISNDLTLHAQWVLDACSAPAAPAISGTASRTEGQTITLTATCASGADGSTTYRWYKGNTWDSKSQVQAAMTAGAGGRTFTKASCIAGDAGKYWCEASNGTGCEAHNETGFTVTVSAAVAEHIYYYKDANHYSDGTYSDPEGNEAVKKDNQSLSSPWMICNGCKAGVDSVVAHGATYDGKNNYMNAYIKLPTGGNATTKNIKFALTAGYTGTLTMKIGGYENNPTVTLQPLVAGVLGDAISYSGTVSGVATTEDNFGEITWNLTTAGGTYVLTVTSKTGYISQIDMTTATTATFNVTYNGNGETGGSVPSDATNYAANASVTVQAQGSMVKTNYTFGGWNTANNGTGTNYVAGSGTFNITGATTLYAHWTQSINLAPGAKGSGTNGATVSWNGTAVRGFTAHTAAGYSLTGYYTDPSGGTKVLNADGSFAATNIDGYITDGKWSRTGAEATLYAQWSGSAIVTNTLGVGSSSKWKSTISTTAPLQITSLSALAAVGELAIEDANGTSASGRALTCKVEASGATTKTDGKYLQLSFSIAAGYKLRVTGLDVTVRSVSKAGKYHLELVGTTGSLIPDDEQVASGAVNTIFDDAYNVELTGNVTLKLWAYGKDGSNLMTYYRLGSPIAIYGAVEESCTPPTFSGLDYSATEYTQGNPASAISVTGAENVVSSQWKYNTVNDRTSGTECGTGSSVTPSTASTGTRYYWCELTNGCTTVKTSTVAITVSASASNPSVTWSDVKLNGAATTVNYGGGKYELRATVNETGWGGTLESSMVTAPAGIYIHNIGTGTEAGKQYIEFQFDVTTAFDREANETIGFHLSLPAISGWNALTSDKQVSYTACDEGEGAAGQVAIPLTATAQTSASNPQNYWEVAEAGWLAFNYGSAVSVLPAATAYRTSEVDFGYYVATTNKKKWMFQPYIAGVNKVRVAFRAAGNLSSGQASVSKFYYDTEYFSSPGSHENLIGDVSANQATYTSGENGYIEFTVPEMAANSYGAFELANSSIEIYGIVLYSENTGSGGTIETDPTWSGGLNKDGSSVVNRNQGDANFTYTISTTTNTLGGITYSSSNSSVAEVNATTGEVRITATGESTQTAVITATLARSGCYQPAIRTYTVRVTGNACTDPIGTIAAEDLGCSGTRMTFSGYAEGATIQWYKDGNTIDDDGGDANVYTATEAGSYYAVAHLNCDRQSNSILVTAAEVDADRVVEKWYIKNGRLTPDIKLWTLDEGSHLVSVAWSPSNATGLNQEGDIYESDGAVYLTGRAPGSNGTGEDKSYTLTLTINNGCSGSTILNDASKQITIVHQKNTDKHVLAFVVTGKQNGGFTESIPASQTTSVDLYNEIAKNFDVLATNIYATDDEQKIKEYYSQFDIICITDYPNTKTKGAHSVSYSDAIGVMVDIRPVLTMEAWVSGLSNWNKKGISGDPKSPTTRQYSMLLQCKDHEVFSGTTLTEVGEGDEKMYRIHMVDETLHPYDTLDANYGSGTHESKKGYRYGSYPALQGFTFSQAMEDADLLPIGLIDDGAGKDLQVGLERQHDMSARMMVLGINSTAMERLTADGERIVINALKYLMKKNAEEIADCSTSFVGGAEGDGENWMNPDNWTGNTVPDKTQKVRILAPCTVPAGERVHVAGVLIAPNDGGTYGGSTPTTGSLTIAAGGALVVDGKVEAVTAPAYNRPRATSVEDLTIQTSSTAQGALIFDNSDGETQATVELYSLGRKEGGHYQFQYYAVPMDYVSVSESFAGSDIYTYVWHEATGWERRGYYTGLEAFEGVGITTKSADPKTYTMTGTLTSTATKEITLTKDAEGYNLIGNSWTAPIQISQLEEDNSSLSKKTVYIYIAGNDTVGGGTEGTSPGQWTAIPFSAAGFSEWSGLKVIPAMQAFELVPTSEETLTLDYDKVVRGDNKSLTEPLHAPRRVADHAGIELMRIRVADSQTRTDLHLFEGERFSDEFDNGWEAAYMDGDDGTTKLYADVALGRMAVVATDELEGTLLGFAPGKEMDYTFSFGGEGMGYYLNDLKLKTSTLISEEATYSFTYEEGDTNRFYISRTPIDAPQTPTGVENTHSGTVKAHKFIYNDKLYIMLNGRVYSAEGQIVK